MNDDDWTDITMDTLRDALNSMRGITTRSIRIVGREYYVVRIGEYYPFDLEAAFAWCEEQFGPPNDQKFPYNWFQDNNRGFVFDAEDKRVAFLLKWNNVRG